MQTEIIIPTFNQENHTIKCLNSIEKYTENYRVFWLDNGSSEISRARVMPVFMKHKNRINIWSANNLGFVGGVNLALRVLLRELDSKAKYIVIQNNDTVVTQDWLTGLIRAMEADERVMAAGPMTSTEGSWQGWKNVCKELNVKVPDGTEQFDREAKRTIFKESFGDMVREVPMIAFFCTVFRRRIFEEIGWLDPQFGTGLGDDDDFTLRIREAGYKVVFVPSVYVEHNHRTTFKAIYDEQEIVNMQRENLSKYKKKHGLRG